LDSERLGAWNERFDKHNIPKEARREFAEALMTEQQAQAKQTADAWTAIHEEWTRTIKADPEIGGKQFDEATAAARSVVDRFGDDDLKADMDLYGFGNHPGLIKTFARIGKAMGDGKFDAGGPAASAKDPVDILYPDK
jgi:hypothetical protein